MRTGLIHETIGILYDVLDNTVDRLRIASTIKKLQGLRQELILGTLDERIQFSKQFIKHVQGCTNCQDCRRLAKQFSEAWIELLQNKYTEKPMYHEIPNVKPGDLVEVIPYCDYSSRLVNELKNPMRVAVVGEHTLFLVNPECKSLDVKDETCKWGHRICFDEARFRKIDEIEKLPPEPPLAG